jgi:hypothetical protein
MKRRKTQQTIRAEREGVRKRMAEQNVWSFIQDADIAGQWGSFDFGTTSFTVDNTFSIGDLITINASDTTACAFGIDLAYKHSNPKRVHPARRRKAIQDQKDMMNDQLIIHSGGSVLNCKKIGAGTWVITGEGIS